MHVSFQLNEVKTGRAEISCLLGPEVRRELDSELSSSPHHSGSKVGLLNEVSMRDKNLALCKQ